MRPSQLLLLSAGLGGVLISLSFVLNRLDRASLQPEPSTTPSLSPSSFVRMSVEDFMERYFAALNQHDFDTAYAFLSPAWGIDRQVYQRYWRQFKAGSIKAEILSINQPSAQSAIVILNWSGNHTGKIVKVKFRCSLRATPTSYRIEQCK